MKRYLSLDLLRGITIFGMVFCAIIPYGVLPGWMYHIQTPPPSHIVDLTLTGLSWVDLVFPIFIFCMGVAIPLSGNRKILSSNNYVKETFERFFMLWLFSYLYVILNYSSVDSIWAQITTIAGFLALFPLYMVLKPGRYRKYLRISGILSVSGLIIVGHFVFGEVISLDRRGIIIFLLAFLYLFASLIWYYTQKNVKVRVMIFFGLLIFSAITMHFKVAQTAYQNETIRWFFNMEYFYFLLILIPATFIGDLLYKKMNTNDPYNPLPIVKPISHVFFISMVALTAWLCYAFYMRLFLENLIVTTIILAGMWLFVNTYAKHYKDFFVPAAIMLIAGILVEQIEGGIQKSPCTISYCFVTFSISVFLLMFSDYISHFFPRSYFVRIFSGSGSNPLMSYIAFNSFIIPLFYATGLIAIYRATFPSGYPWIGVLSAMVFVIFMMALVSRLSENKIYWKA